MTKKKIKQKQYFWLFLMEKIMSFCVLFIIQLILQFKLKKNWLLFKTEGKQTKEE